MTIFGDGGQTRDFVYVGDVVEAFVAAGESRVTGCCNIATGRETSVLELARELGLRTRFAPARRGRGPALLPGPARPRRTRLGWRARTPLAAGLAATLTSTARAPRRARARLSIAMNPAARAAAQNASGASSYSATKTALPGRRERPQPVALAYWKHCSLSAQSKSRLERARPGRGRS